MRNCEFTNEHATSHNPMRYPTLNQSRRPRARALGALLLLAGLSAAQTSFGQAIWYEDFEGLTLGPNVNEALAGSAVWTKGPPPGWVADDSGVPGIGTPTDGVTEWAGWSFANKNWWAQTAGDQNRSRFSRGQGIVMIADPDEWDDAAHGGTGIPADQRTAQGLWYDTYITTSAINVAGAAANSLVLTFDSSWRPEYDGDYHQTGIIEAIWDSNAPQQVTLWSSDSSSPDFKPDDDGALAGEGIYTATNAKEIYPLNNPAGAQQLKIKIGMFDAGNDWWWAVDNIRVGRPPLVTGVSATGVGFSVEISEALGQTVNSAAGVTAQLDGQAVSVTTETVEGGVLVRRDQSPAIFPPRSQHTVRVSFTTGDGRQVNEEVTFTAPGYTTVAATPNSFTATITETAYLEVNEGAGVQLELDGAAITAQSVQREDIADAPDRIHVRYTAATPFASASAHSVKLTYTTKTAQTVTETVSFTAPTYATLPTALATAVGTGATPGMRWRTHQLAVGTTRDNTIAAAERQLRGELGPSVHEPGFEVAGGYFEVPYVNFEENAGNGGRFNLGATAAELQIPDDYIPGIPGPDGSLDYIAGEALTYVEFPQSGIYTLVVNSDDGFQLSVGNTNNPTFLVLGAFDGGRGAADSQFYVRVDQAGVYLFRLLWFEGSGGASVEWFSVAADGRRALVNGLDVGVTPLKAFRRRTVAEPDLPSTGGITNVARQGNQVVITFTGTLKTAAQVRGPYTDVAGATSPYSVNPTDAQRFYIAE